MTKKIFTALLLLLIAVCAQAQYNKRYFYYTAQRAMMDGKYRQAIDLMSMLIDFDANESDAYFMRAIAKYNLNDIVGADRDFTLAVKTNPAFAQAYQYRAIVRSMMGNYSDALQDFDTATSIRPDVVGSFFSRGVTYLLNQQFDKAIEDFTTCIRRDNSMIDAYINRGTAHLFLKDTVAAVADYNNALKIDFRNSNALVRRGGVYAQQEKYDAAFEDFNAAIKYDSVNVAAYFNRALVYAQTHKPLQAADDFTRVLKIDPKNSLTYFNRAILRSQIGDYNGALEDYNKVVELTPNNVLGIYNRAMLNSKLGNLTYAIEDYSKAIDLYPDFANAYLNRASIKYLLQDKVGAESDRAIAKKKIDAYRSKMDNESFSAFVDTSKVMTRLLSFDQDFGNKDFDDIKNKNFDIKQLPQFRLTFTDQKKLVRLNRRYEPDGLMRLMKDIDPDAMVVGYKSPAPAESQIMKGYATGKIEIKHGKADTWEVALVNGIVQHSMKQYTNAVEQYSKAILFNNTDPYLYMNRAVARTEMTEFISSLDSKSKRFVVGVDKFSELNNISRTYDYNAALDDINKAISMAPDVAYFYYNRAVIKCLMGDMPAAMEDYTKAISLYENFAEALYNRGMIQIYLKDFQKGFLDISRAGELGLQEAYEVTNYLGKSIGGR